MKKIIPITLILFWLVNCASMQDEQRKTTQSKGEPAVTQEQRKSLQRLRSITHASYFFYNDKGDLWLKAGNYIFFIPVNSIDNNLVAFSLNIEREHFNDTFKGSVPWHGDSYADYSKKFRDEVSLHSYLIAETRFLVKMDSGKPFLGFQYGANGKLERIDSFNDSRAPSDSTHILEIFVDSEEFAEYYQLEFVDKNIKLIRRDFSEKHNDLVSGKINKRIDFDPSKETKTNYCIQQIIYDGNENGRMDKWDYYENCNLVRREIDENENGTKEEIIYYNKKGEYDHSWSIGGDNVKKANAALEAKKYDEAINFYKAANQELSKEWGADSNEVCGNLNRIGETNNAAQKFPEAIKTFNQGLALKQCSDWNYNDLSSGLLLTYALMDDIKMIIKSGIDAAKQYAKTNEGKKHFEIEGFLGYGYYKEKEYQAAYKHLIPALDLTLQEQKESCKGKKQCSYFNPFYFSMFGNICSRLNKNAEAVAYYKKALEFRSQLPPEHVDSFEFSFAYQTYIIGDPKKAISMNERFLNNKDTKKAALVNHAFFHLALEDLQKANQFMKNAVAAGLKKDDWDEDIEFFKIYYPKQASLLPEIIKTSGQY